MTTANRNVNAGFVTDKFPQTVVDSYGNLSVRERTPQFSLLSNVNLSVIRDIQIATTGGTVTHGGPDIANEYKLSTTATANASIRMESADTGRFQPGSSGEAALGVRLENLGNITGNQVLRWGYFDNSDGFGFGYSTQGLFVFTLRAGVETRVLRTDWNVDKLDSNGASGIDLNLLFGHVYIIEFSWFGVATFKILHNDPITNEQKLYNCHRIVPTIQTSILNPNLPVSASISNGSTAAVAPNLYVSGRSFSVIGRYIPIARHTSSFVGPNKSIPSTTWTKLISFRQKPPFRAIKTSPNGYDITVAANTVRIMYMLNTVITSPTWIVPTLHNVNETALEIDLTGTIDGTLATGAGTKLWSAVHAGSTVEDGSSNTFATSHFDFTVPAFTNFNITILARAVTGSATVNFLPRFIEEW